MKFLRRSIVGSIAGAAAAWSWRNRSKLANRADRAGSSPQGKDHRANPVTDQPGADRNSARAQGPADVSVPVS